MCGAYVYPYSMSLDTRHRRSTCSATKADSQYCDEYAYLISYWLISQVDLLTALLYFRRVRAYQTAAFDCDCTDFKLAVQLTYT